MNLVPLFEEALEFQNYNGTVLSNGKVAVFYIGRTRLADIFNDIEGLSPAENPRILDNLGMGPIYVNPAFDYEMVVFDAYGSELFSVKKYVLSKGEHSTANVVVTPSENIAVSAWTIGDVQVYMPYLTGQLGKVYEGIEPIVVNNIEDKISAQHVPLGVQDPLYFVQDDEEACIIGFSGETIPEGTMNESAFGYQDGQITSYNGSAFSAGNSYEAGSYVDIDGNTINVTGLQPAGNYQSAGDYVVHDELSSYATQDWVNEQGFLTAIPSEYVTENTLQSGLSSKLDSTAFSTVSGNFLTAHQSLDGLMSADLLEISDNKITGYNGTAFAGQGGGVTGDYELSAGSGISIVDYPLEQKTVISVTAQGGNPEVEQAVIDNSATWDSVTSKADVTAIPSLEGYATENWVTGQGYITNDAITGKQDITGMTAYQPVGSYLTADALDSVSGDWNEVSAKLDTTAFSDVSGTFLTAHQDISNKLDTTAFSDVSGSFLTAVPDTYLQNTDLSTTDGKVTAISGIPLSAGGSVPTGVMTESGLEYDASGNISAYSGSAFATQLPEEEEVEFEELDITSISAATDYVTATSGDINATIDNVSANSGAWGGSALPISAGPGIKVNLVDNTLVFSNDETVLFEGDALHNNATATLSEPFTNFEKIKVYGHTDDGSMYPWSTEVPTFSGIGFIGVATNNAGWSKWFGLSVPDTTHIVPSTGYVVTWGNTVTGYLTNTWGITRVLGINRIAGE